MALLNLSQINHSKNNREHIANHLVAHPHEIQEYLDVIAAKTDKEYFKASWALEFVSRININVLLPYLSQILALANEETAHQAIRPFAKIIETLVLIDYSKDDTSYNLSADFKNLMATQCFDWLITEQKVAAKAYSMTSLFQLGKDIAWIHPELKIYLEDNFNQGTAAFKARARHILKKL